MLPNSNTLAYKESVPGNVDDFVKFSVYMLTK